MERNSRTTDRLFPFANAPVLAKAADARIAFELTESSPTPMVMSAIGRRVLRLEQKHGGFSEFAHLSSEELCERLRSLRDELAASDPDDPWLAEADAILDDEARARANWPDYPYSRFNPRPAV